VIGIDGDAEVPPLGIQRLAPGPGLRDRVEQASVGRVERMQGLQRDRDAGGLDRRHQGLEPPQDLGTRAVDVARSIRQPAHHRDELARAQRRGRLERSPVVVDRLHPRDVGRVGERGRAAIAAHAQPGGTDRLGIPAGLAFVDLPPPGRDPAEAGRGHALRGHGNGLAVPQGGRVEAAPVRPRRQITQG
jgi:hypothetical protein